MSIIYSISRCARLFCPSDCLSVCLSLLGSFTFLSLYLYVYLTLSLSLSLSASLSVFLSLSSYLSFCLSFDIILFFHYLNFLFRYRPLFLKPYHHWLFSIISFGLHVWLSVNLCLPVSVRLSGCWFVCQSVCLPHSYYLYTVSSYTRPIVCPPVTIP